MSWNALAHRALTTATLYGRRNIGRVSIHTGDDFVVIDPQMDLFPQAKLIAVMIASTAGLAWSRAEPRAPAISAEGIRALVDLAATHGFALIEPDLPLVAAGARSAADRAIRATIVYGPTARALLFVPAKTAPKNGLVKLHDERILDGWIESRLPLETVPELRPGPPMTGRDLLRAVRGNRAASTSDGPALAKQLARAWREGIVELYAADPAVPLV